MRKRSRIRFGHGNGRWEATPSLLQTHNGERCLHNQWKGLTKKALLRRSVGSAFTAVRVRIVNTFFAKLF